MMIKNLSIKTRMNMVIGFISAMMIVGGLAGIVGISMTNEGLRRVYEERMRPTGQLQNIDRLMLLNRLNVSNMLANASTSVSNKKENTTVVNESEMDASARDIEKNRDEITAIWKTYYEAIVAQDEKQLADNYAASRKAFVTEGLQSAIGAIRARDYVRARDVSLNRVPSLYLAAKSDLDALLKYHHDGAAAEYTSAAQRYRLIQYTAITLTIMGVILALWIGVMLSNSITRPLKRVLEIFDRIAQGNFDSKIEVNQSDEVGKVLESLKQTQSRLKADVEETKRIATESLRIKVALDNVSTNVMMADPDLNIIYMNKSIVKMLSAAEADLRKDLPSFNVSKLMGANIDQFHKNPAHQRRLLGAFTSTHDTQIKVAGLTFRLYANPVIDADGTRLGSVVEWFNITEELAALEREHKLAEENLRVRIALDNVSTGVMIADNDRNIIYVNRAVVKTLSDAESDIRRQLPNFSASKLIGTNIDSFHKVPAHQANLLSSFTSTYTANVNVGGRTMVVRANPVVNEKGERLGAVAEWVDRTLEVAVENEVSGIVQAASRGDLTQRISLQGKEGFFRNLSEGINQMVSATEAIINDTVSALERISNGDMTQRIDGDYEGAYGVIKDNANLTIDRLTEIVTNIKTASDAINTAAKEIAAGNTDLSQRTEQQASSLEETASSMEELASTVKQNAENAKQANQMASAASGVAVKGGEVVGEVVNTMSAINSASHKIVDIISVIDGIAFQTNILALNAAVEAARAGEQGRGFAVVAGEVRNLAQRSAAAAKEIKQLISDSVEKVEDGSRQVEQAGSTMEEIVTSVKRVTDIMAEITAASVEQSSGIDQVNQAVTQMDEVTQQNAALVEEAAAAAESLEEQAQTLIESISIFRIPGSVPTTSSRTTVSRNVSLPGSNASRQARPPLPAPPSGNSDGEWEEF